MELLNQNEVCQFFENIIDDGPRVFIGEYGLLFAHFTGVNELTGKEYDEIEPIVIYDEMVKKLFTKPSKVHFASCSDKTKECYAFRSTFQVVAARDPVLHNGLLFSGDYSRKMIILKDGEYISIGKKNFVITGIPTNLIFTPIHFTTMANNLIKVYNWEKKYARVAHPINKKVWWLTDKHKLININSSEEQAIEYI